MRRVLRRFNRFLQLIPKTVGQEEDRSNRIDAGHELLDNLPDVPPVRGPLESVFPMDRAWLAGELHTADVQKPRGFRRWRIISSSSGTDVADAWPWSRVGIAGSCRYRGRRT